MVRTRPIQKFAAAVGQCTAETSMYGKCILADYNSVHKDKCLKEFLRLKDCYLVYLTTMPLPTSAFTESTTSLTLEFSIKRSLPARQNNHGRSIIYQYLNLSNLVVMNSLFFF
ncbi:hypothetical protein BDP81DRAFT_180328 [Colletotrichum phormii]|uniref:Conidiophore development protein hymA n=1 Tax=Colletotrichum phormii TaxID=359342 RepID=A0AAJ0EHU0_9PEZI|nr:uncharacterized protein BDP81DRAFT_180328 [Colletotrichum phormii]KAK1639608.1 hypothetical protein BDP81DRAFT_180328 [Colletotrichum phormii]